MNKEVKELDLSIPGRNAWVMIAERLLTFGIITGVLWLIWASFNLPILVMILLAIIQIAAIINYCVFWEMIPKESTAVLYRFEDKKVGSVILPGPINKLIGEKVVTFTRRQLTGEALGKTFKASGTSIKVEKLFFTWYISNAVQAATVIDGLEETDGSPNHKKMNEMIAEEIQTAFASIIKDAKAEDVLKNGELFTKQLKKRLGLDDRKPGFYPQIERLGISLITVEVGGDISYTDPNAQKAQETKITRQVAIESLGFKARRNGKFTAEEEQAIKDEVRSILIQQGKISVDVQELDIKGLGRRGRAFIGTGGIAGILSGANGRNRGQKPNSSNSNKGKKP